MDRTASDSACKRSHHAARRRSPAAVVAAGAAACLLVGAGSAGAQGDSLVQTPPAATGVTATLEQCVTSVVQSERSATFTGEMTALPGTVKMSMRIDVEERGPEDLEFHAVSGQGIGVWRSSEPKVKVYKYLRQVTNLSSPAAYRALVHFRWINARGHVLRRAERVTTRCLQPAAPSESTPPSSTPPQSGASSSSGASATPSA
jgi:hypothetical protein